MKLSYYSGCWEHQSWEKHLVTAHEMELDGVEMRYTPSEYARYMDKALGANERRRLLRYLSENALEIPCLSVGVSTGRDDADDSLTAIRRAIGLAEALSIPNVRIDIPLETDTDEEIDASNADYVDLSVLVGRSNAL